MYVMIENQGVADAMGMRLMGASSKGSHQIGRFGTGWKYGLASAVRMAGDFNIYLGGRAVRVSTTTVEFRGQPHQEVTLDGVAIGVTDQLGKDWEPWMVLREFISNAIDEGGVRVDVVDEDHGLDGTTRIFLPLEPFKDVVDHLDDYFCLGEVDGQVVTPLGRALPKKDANQVRVFKKGVLVKRLDARSAFDYELNDVPIGEDRLAGDVRKALWSFLDGAPIDVKRAVLRSRFEGESYDYQKPDESWLEAFGKHLVTSHRVGAEDELVVHYGFVEVAERVGARTIKSDKAAKAAQRKTMPASFTAREACKKLGKVGIEVNPAVILMAELDGGGYMREDGVIYLSKSLSQTEITDALIVLGTLEGWEGSRDHLGRLAALVRKLGKL